MELKYTLLMIKRAYESLEKYLKPGKVLIIYGPRRVGKTTLLQNFLFRTKLKYRLDSGDNIRVQNVLSSRDFSLIAEYTEGFEVIAIDEAQEIPNIGMGLKIIVDQNPNIVVIATGSSSFDLAHQVGEPLTGRKRTLTLFPVSQGEMRQTQNSFQLKEKLESFLIYGAYPEIVTAKTSEEKRVILDEIVNSYLLKDVLSLEKIKSPKILLDLLKLIAFQVGSEVSLNEISTQLHIDVKTAGRYLDLLEKTFVVFGMGGLSRNLRKEVTSKKKYYFMDNGIRNAVISQFNALDSRNDAGPLWENFIVVERMKKRAYEGISGSQYFWRTYDQQEIDLVEERDGRFYAFECKWSDHTKNHPPRDWARAYPESKYHIISPANYLEWVS